MVASEAGLIDCNVCDVYHHKSCNRCDGGELCPRRCECICHCPVRDRCEHLTAQGRRCTRRGFVLLSLGNGQALWSCGNHLRMVRRYLDSVVSVAYRSKDAPAGWRGPVFD